MRPSSTKSASRSSPSQRRWITTSATPSTALASRPRSRARDAIQRQRTTVGSHERIGIFRVFGRDAGFSALFTAYATSIRCVIPEYKVNLDKLIQLLLEEKRTNPR